MIRQRLAVALISLSAAGLVGIVGWEGYTGQAVRPVPGDVPTVGFGSTTRPDGTPVQMGDTTTPPAALARAMADITRYEGALRNCVRVPLYQHEYDAFASLAYNIGPTAFCASTLVRRLNALDYPGACREILRWNKFKGRVMPGLVNRRQAEYRRCMGESP